MIVLGIESSCDETAAAVVRDGHEVLSSVISSQIGKHAQFGGVVPELAAREHLKNITPVVTSALAEAGLGKADLEAIAVTARPGLVPALLVGNAYAKGLAAALGVPIIGINHFLGHIYGAFIEHREILEDPGKFPLVALVVSGGHTAIVLIPADGNAVILGSTLDDAAGEALDKAAKLMGLPYPGGPVIDKLSREGNPMAFDFPRSLTGRAGKAVSPEHRYDFSFSGVKTSLLYTVTKEPDLLPGRVADLAASFQEAVIDVLTIKAMDAVRHSGAKLLCLCGGVACNSRLRAKIEAACLKRRIAFLPAPPKYCTDNAAMIGGLAWHYLRKNSSFDANFGINARLEATLGRLPFAPLATTV